MGRAKTIEEMGTSIVEKFDKGKRRRGSRTSRPRHLEQSSWTKLCWRWMRGGNDLWKRIWTQKYHMPITMEGILKLEETPKGSTIWELASQNRNIINNYAFWEIRGGSIARF